jgi:DNA-binding LytR/AlgR family response regulator
MRVVLADDEIYGLKRLKAACLSIDAIEIVGEARSGTELLALAEELTPDIVITDIQMPGMTGVEAVLQISSPRPEVVFVTAHDQFALIAFEIDVADYLMKPVMVDRLKESVTRAARRRRMAAAERQEGAANGYSRLASESGKDVGIWVPSRNGRSRVAADAIDWIEAAGDYAMIHTAVRSYLLRATMGALETELAGTGIRRVHRCALVRTTKIVELNRTGRSLSITLADGAVIQVGGSYLANLKIELGLE